MAPLPRPRPMLLGLLLGLVLGLLTSCVSSPPSSADPTPSPTTPATPSSTPSSTPSAPADPTRVLAISIDGLSVRALRRLGPERTPNLHRLLAEGASTRNARTQVEQTVTLPNHTSMVTGRRIDADHGGHGVTWNSDTPGTTVQGAAGEPVRSVFTVVHRAGGSTALFATEQKFSLFRRSWPKAIDRTTIVQDGDAAVVRRVRRDLVRHDRAFTFLHLGSVDEAGHAHGWLGRRYLRAVARTDRRIGLVLHTIAVHPSLDDVAIVLTADHGGVPGTHSHDDPSVRANYRVPFVIWGPDVTAGRLYAMNPAYTSPGARRVGFRGEQPIRNGDLANAATDLLGLRAVPGSLWDRRHRLRWR